MNAYQLRELLKSGKRLPKPRPCPPLIYNLMIRCWNASPAMRPTFEELISSFELLPYLVIGAGDEQYARKLVTSSVENVSFFHRTGTGAYLFSKVASNYILGWPYKLKTVKTFRHRR